MWEVLAKNKSSTHFALLYLPRSIQTTNINKNQFNLQDNSHNKNYIVRARLSFKPPCVIIKEGFPKSLMIFTVTSLFAC